MDHPTGKKLERLFTPIKQTKGNRGGQCRYIEIAVNPLKDMLWRLSNGQGMLFEVLPDVSKSYQRHMRAEVRKEGTVGKQKRVMAYWETTDRQNHLWDCEVYGCAAAMIFNLFDGSNEG